MQRQRYSDEMVASWKQHDRKPDWVVIRPRLKTPTGFYRQSPVYPKLLNEWWLQGQVEAQIIDTNAKRTPTQVWELTRHLESRRYDQRYLQAVTWALQVEKLKVEAYLLSLQNETSVWKMELVQSCRVLGVRGNIEDETLCSQT